MSTKLLVTLRNSEDEQTIRNIGCERLAEYPSSWLVRCTEAQQAALEQTDLEATALESPVVKVTGAAFAFSQALEANERQPIALVPDRQAYYLVELIGPAKGEWLATIEERGGIIHGNLPSFTLLVGMRPNQVSGLQEQPWVEAIAPYRPTMKVSPKLRPGIDRTLSTASLTTLELEADASEERQAIEIDLFPGENASAIAQQVRAAGGVVLSETSTTVTATVTPREIAQIAREQGVQAILPYRMPEFFNDRALAIMDVPPDRTFGNLTLRGTDQIVAVADSGLDTGNAATVHADFSGRIVDIASWPTTTSVAIYLNDPPGNDDGPADENSGHGTHVAGSVLSNGAAAIAAPGASVVPQGMAPAAQLYFQAVEQRVNWKSVAQLNAEGIPVPFMPWPPDPVTLLGLPDDLNDLFGAAYTSGARVHTNSWGAPVNGVYNANSRDVDTYMWNQRDMLILFSAGNSGVDANSNGVIDPDSIGSPGTAKNCVTVGASENNRPNGSTPTPGLDINWTDWNWPALGAAGHVSDDAEGMAAFSSRGPTDDGRIKPDVVAPGTNVLSTRSSLVDPDPLWGDLDSSDPLHNLYCWSGGTSMSTPLVAGAAALIRQHLVQQRGHFQAGVKPSGALIKAFLVNGADPMAGQFPGEIPNGQNSVSGFGRVNLTRSLTPGALQQTLFADEPDQAVETGEIRTYEIQAVDLSQPLKVTLVWTDAPSIAGTGGLQNQLYLQIREPGGTLLNGDVTAFPTVTNNVQQVIIPAPTAGPYEIRVRGVSVIQQSPGASSGPNPRQDFALAVANALGFSVQPVSIAQAIDTTGSMGFFGYMAPAKERATQLVDFLRINDKISITEFSKRSGVADARTPYSLRLLANFNPDWTDARGAIAALVSEGTTPIGAGLLEAWNQLDPEPSSRPRAIVLLSDGLNNEPPDPLSILSSIPDEVPIFTIALGPAGSASTLQSIASSRPNGAYYAIDSDEDIHRLHEIYAQVQALVSGAALIGLSSAALASQAEQQHVMLVEPETAEVAFTLSWDRQHQSKGIELIAIGPDGRRYDASTPATQERQGSSYQVVRVAVPQAGQWTLQVRNLRSEVPIQYTVSGATQSALQLSCEVAKVSAEGFVLLAHLIRNHKPFDEAKVVARITLPTRSHRDILEQYGARLKELELPEALDEPGFTEEQRLTMKLALFGHKFGRNEGGLYQRKTVEVKLKPQGQGTWMTEVPMSVPGNATVEVIARGTLQGMPWQRYATHGAQVLDTTPSEPKQKLHIQEIFSIPARWWWQTTTLGVRVATGDGQPVTPEDGAIVDAVLSQGSRQLSFDNMSYHRDGKYYVGRLWNLRMWGFHPGTGTLAARVKLQGKVIAEDSAKIQL
jgi:hypothetical protein